MQIRLVYGTTIPNPLTNMLLFATRNIHAENAPHITPRFRDCFELVSNRPIQGRV